MRCRMQKVNALIAALWCPDEATPDLVYAGSRQGGARSGARDGAPTLPLIHNVKKILPRAKIIVIMRNPTDRYATPQTGT
jgi:hypothetical protein